MEASPELKKYFEKINKEVKRCYALAASARAKGLDPESVVPIPVAENMAERVVGLISVVVPKIVDTNITSRIMELEKEFGLLDWRVGFKIAEEVAKEEFCKFENRQEAVEVGIRVGFAYLTLGIVSAPLEGFIGIKVKKRKDGKEYLALQYAGPIRAAGGTAASTSVILSDYVRIKLGYASYDPEDIEVNRYVAEVHDYNERVTNLQYLPSEEELRFLVSHLPVEVDGDPTEKFEVSNYKDLPRIETNLIRGGVALVLAEGLAQKAPKLWKRLAKWGKEFSLEWDWLAEFITLKEKLHAAHSVEKKSEGDSSGQEKRVKPNNTYIMDLVAGRPILTHPLREGGFRLRYGRTRVSGFSACGVSPATLIVLNKYIAIGTQLKTERPGKASTVTVCHSLEGPIVRLGCGSVLQLKTEEEAKQYVSEIEEVVFLGDILFNYGDFSENGQALVPPGYCPEWWALELEKEFVKEKGTVDFRKSGSLDKSSCFLNKSSGSSNGSKGIIKNGANKSDNPTNNNPTNNNPTNNNPTNNNPTNNNPTNNNPTNNNSINDIHKNDKCIIVDEQRINEFIENPLLSFPTCEEAFWLSSYFSIPLHPSYTFYWKLISGKSLLLLISWLKEGRIKLTEDVVSKIVMPYYSRNEMHHSGKKVLEELGIPHKVVSKENIVLEKNEAFTLASCLGLKDQESLSRIVIDPEKISSMNGLEVINLLSDVVIRDKAGTFIGARMGRPEKAKMRHMTGSPQVMFPVGDEGDRLRSFQAAIQAGKVRSVFPLFFCEKCQRTTIYSCCEMCNSLTKKKFSCRFCGDLAGDVCRHGQGLPYKNMDLDIKHYFEKAKELLGENLSPDLIKGVRGTSNKEHLVEHLAKGILRAKHGIYVNKDGTTRYDCTELPLTHFRPKEIKTSIPKLKSLGYLNDIYGNELVDSGQLLELRPQDVILPGFDSLEESGPAVLSNVTRFVDELLVKFYKLKPFYKVKEQEDLVGHLVIGLAPHISAGLVGRIIGFSETQGLITHPLYHAGMRRDCDGDEAGVMLLMDALLNFSRQYLPEKRGAKTMDAPLVLTSTLYPSEVDDQVHGIDVVWKYPLEFYESALAMKNPWEVKYGEEKKKIAQLGDRLGTAAQYEDFGFTHHVDNFNRGILCSAYKTQPSMTEKLFGQMDIARKVRAVDMDDVARLVFQKHFLKDIKGNLRKFSMQQFRCVKCNTKYRRPPLSSMCNACGGRLIFTISEGSVVKYLEPSLLLAEKYEFSPYLKQTLDILKVNVDHIFGKEKEKQVGLSSFLG